MITIYNLEQIKTIRTISKELKEELLKYFQEIAEGIVGEKWEAYNLEEVGPILVIENEDSLDVLDEYGLMQGSKTIPQSLPEFALRAKVGEVEMLKVIWVVGDSFGVAVYYPLGTFGEEFEQWIEQYLVV